MPAVSLTAFFACDIEKAWQTVTDVKNYAWRSDLGKTEVINERQFVEYTKQGYATAFTVTAFEPRRRWAFDMENTNMQGHWEGVFTEKPQGTEIVFTETVTAKRFFMKPFVKLYLQKQQAQFASDLKKALME